ncbi:MAG: imidazole glycerol phosphate synthase subunit HisH [Alphaproteobacteria bacterium]|nr:imidazole glycerol phosphate synthase subunit HisH [Alphaproteobacteria bacterium]
MRVSVIDIGCANLASVIFALERLGAGADIAREPADIARAERLIFPGVGSAAYAAEQLSKRGLAEPLRGSRAPLLGLCLGMQLLFEASEEGDATGLGLLPGRVARLDAGENAPWPHMGWSRVRKTRAGSRLLEGVEDGAFFYFVHGYAAPPGAATIGVAEYGEAFSAAVEDGRRFGCQFHPERSGAAGARVLSNFLNAS